MPIGIQVRFMCAVSVWRHKYIILIICSLHNTHGMNTHRAGHVYLSVCMIGLLNHWIDYDEIWYRYCVIGGYPKIIHLNFLHSVTQTWHMHKLVKPEQHYWNLI
jgi:hypothetical protein